MDHLRRYLYLRKQNSQKVQYQQKMQTWFSGLILSNQQFWLRLIEERPYSNLIPLITYRITARGEVFINRDFNPSHQPDLSLPSELDPRILARQVYNCSERCGNAYIKSRLKEWTLSLRCRLIVNDQKREHHLIIYASERNTNCC
jgi:hypothetical protein